jgi:gamma-glutamyltranspeptidase/glutathione hydrolase
LVNGLVLSDNLNVREVKSVVARLILSAFLLTVTSTAAFAAAPASGNRGMVVTEQSEASHAGLEVLRTGGNAIDAAVAVGYALAVVNPCCGNIGGGGFMLIHRAKGGDTFINFREKAPLRATRDMYLDSAGNVVPGRSTRGWLAAGVPGTVMGLERARTEYGTMTRDQLMASAISLARNGFTLGAGDAAILAPEAPVFAKEPNVAAIFTHAGAPLRVGDRLRQPQLATTLELIARDGPDAFYRGDIARRVVAASAANGGLLTMDDMAQYTAQELMPLHCTYRGYTIVSAPPPSSGGTTLCEILGIVEPFPLPAFGFNSAASVHADVEAERLAYVDRNTYLGDPDFVKNPVDRLLSQPYLTSLRKKIGERATRSSDVAPGLGPRESVSTTHYSIADRFGNAVSVTYTINGAFGADVIAGDTGFFLNNEMDDFTSKPGIPNSYGLVQGVTNEIAPGKRPLSSMAPTIALQRGKVAFVAGSPGGSRIITIVLGVLQNVIDYGMNPQDAVDAPRVHHQWQPDTVYVEPDAIAAPAMDQLKALGYTFTPQTSWGVAQAIAIDPRTGTMTGGTDHRHPAGLALGY